LSFHLSTSDESPLPFCRVSNSLSYSPDTREWTEQVTYGDFISSRSFHSAVIYDNCMYLFGGIGPRNLDDFFVLTLGAATSDGFAFISPQSRLY